MNAFDRDRLHEFLQFAQETRPKLDPDNPWADVFGNFEKQLTRTLGRYLPVGRPEPVTVSKKVRKLLVPVLCWEVGEIAAGLSDLTTTAPLFDGLAKLGQHVAFAREVELGVVWDVDGVSRLLGSVQRVMDETGADLAGAVVRLGKDEPAAASEARKAEKALRRLDLVRAECKRFLDEAKKMAAVSERVTVDA